MIARGRAALGRIDGVTWCVIAITLVALWTRTADLGARAYHHDESQHATFSYYYASGSGYRHDPLLHGPLQFHAIALVFRLLGDTDVTARLPAALAGAALVAAPLLLRRWLGGGGTIAAAALITVSPSLLYFSRFAREDALVALPTLLAFVAVWRYREDPRLRWLLLLSASLALSFATKESAYLTAAVLLLYLDAAVAHRLFWWRAASAGAARAGGMRRPSMRAQLVGAAWLLPTAWVFAALWGPLARVRARLRLQGEGLDVRPVEADLLLVTGTLVAPLLAAFARVPLAPLLVAPDQRLVLTTSVIALLLSTVVAIGTEWRARWWLACAGVFLAIALPLFTSLGANPAGVAGLFWHSLDYWLGQQGVRRGNGDVSFYYVMMLPLYEHLVLIPGLLGGAWLTLRRRDAFAAFLLWWFLGTFIALSIAGEKMPWLTMHMALPLALLAAYALDRLARPALARALRGEGSPRAWAADGTCVAVAGLAVALTLYTNYGLNIDHPDTPVEPLIYVQTAPDVPILARAIAATIARGEAQRVLVDDANLGLTWPWAWYARHLPLGYAGPGDVVEGRFADGSIVITLAGTVPAGSPVFQRMRDPVVYHHRWWFPEEGYRATTPASLWEGLRSGSLPRRWLRFVIAHIDRSAVASLDGAVLYPRAPAPP